jgi:hypothetical protein
VNDVRESCPTRTSLMTAWQNAAEAYSQAVAEVTKKIGVVPKPEYDRLSKHAKDARKRAMEAKANLDEHTGKHGCGRGDGCETGDGQAA